MIESFPSRDNNSEGNRRRRSSSISQRSCISNPFYKGPKASNKALGYHSDGGGYYGTAGSTRRNSMTRNDKYSSDAEESSQSKRLCQSRRSTSEATNKPHNFLVNKVESMFQGQIRSREDSLMHQMSIMQENYEAQLHDLKLELHKRTNSITTLEKALMMQTKTINDFRDEMQSRKRLNRTNDKLNKRKDRRRSSQSSKDFENSNDSLDYSLAEPSDNSSSQRQSFQSSNGSSSVDSSKKKAQLTSSAQRRHARDKKRLSDLTEESQQSQQKLPDTRRSSITSITSSNSSRRVKLQRSQSAPRKFQTDPPALFKMRSEPGISLNRRPLNRSSPLHSAHRCGDSVVRVTTTTTRENTANPTTQSIKSSTNDDVSLPPHPRAMNEDQEIVLQRDAEVGSIASESTVLSPTTNNSSIVMLRQSSSYDCAATDDDERHSNNNHRRCFSNDSSIATRTTFDRLRRSSLGNSDPVQTKRKQLASRRRASTSISGSDNGIDRQLQGSNNGRNHPQRENLNISYKRNRRRLLQLEQKKNQQEQEIIKHSQEENAPRVSKQPTERRSVDRVYMKDAKKAAKSPIMTPDTSSVQSSLTSSGRLQFVQRDLYWHNRRAP